MYNKILRVSELRQLRTDLSKRSHEISSDVYLIKSHLNRTRQTTSGHNYKTRYTYPEVRLNLIT